MSNNKIDITSAKSALEQEFAGLSNKADILKSKVFKDLYAVMPTLDPADRGEAGRAINELKTQFQQMAENAADNDLGDSRAIDLTAPFDVNVAYQDRPSLLPIEQGSKHPLTAETEKIIDIFVRMGFAVEDSRQLDDQFNMFEALNFPADHPARDQYDTFTTKEGFIPPAHTSTMQHRILKSGQVPIRSVIPGRTFRNEDVDATHEHTFYQVEGIYVDKGITLADMLGTIKAFLEEYFEQDIEYRTQPFYFPFVEPGLEYLIKMPDSLKKSGQTEDKWLEIMGCGMIHPNVLSKAGIDPTEYSGFAWGFGLDRLVMLKHGIEDVRLFHSARLDFLRSVA
jgi:phenylalanyl-tRNA synthetase alpha chain